MGCDIHMTVEIRKESKWVSGDVLSSALPYISTREDGLSVVPLYSGRNYELFSLLAGVRGSQDPIIEPRGIPEDACSETLEDYRGGMMMLIRLRTTLSES